MTDKILYKVYLVSCSPHRSTDLLALILNHRNLIPSHSQTESAVESHGPGFSLINNYWHFLSLINILLCQELLESFSLNLHRIEKDVARCDRTLEYFSRQENLERLRNIVTTYVWEHLDIGYMQVR